MVLSARGLQVPRTPPYELWANISKQLNILLLKPDEAANRTPQALVQLLIDGLDAPVFSLSHLLLGFDNRERIDHTDLKKAARRHVLDAVLKMAKKKGFLRSFPTLANAVYELLYKLCSSRLTHRPFMVLVPLPSPSLPPRCCSLWLVIWVVCHCV